MKRFIFLGLMMVLVTVPALAGKKSQSVTFPEALQVGTAQVPAGSYQLTLSGDGPEVQVTLLEKDKPLTTFAAKVVAGKYNVALLSDTHGGVEILRSIQLSKMSLVLASGGSSGQ